MSQDNTLRPVDAETLNEITSIATHEIFSRLAKKYPEMLEPGQTAGDIVEEAIAEAPNMYALVRFITACALAAYGVEVTIPETPAREDFQ